MSPLTRHACIAASLCAFACTCPALASDWPQLQRDASHTGFTPDALGSTFSLAWSAKLDPVSTNVQPIVVAGAVIVGTSKGEVIAFDTATGTQKWTRATGGAIRASAASNGSIAFVGSADRYLHAIDVSSGQELWKQRMGAPFRAAPVVEGDFVYAVSNAGDIVKLSAADGKVQWSVGLEVPVFTTPAIADGKLYVLAADAVLRALDTQSGAVAWSHAFVGQPPSRGWVVASQGRVFASVRAWMDYWEPLNKGTELIDGIATEPWSVQRDAVLAHRKASPAWHELWCVSATDGTDVPLPIMTAWRGIGDLSHMPVIPPGTQSADVMFRWSTGEKNGTGGGATVIQWSQHVGSFGFGTGDITPIDNQGAFGAKAGDQAFLITDEGWHLSRSSSELLVSSWHGIWGIDTASHKARAIAVGTGGLQAWSGEQPVALFNSESQATSHEGADGLPGAIADGTIYWLAENQLFALRGAP